MKPKAPQPKPEDGITLAQRIVFAAQVAASAGKTEVAVALLMIIADHFDWGDGNEIELATDAERMARESPEGDRPQHKPGRKSRRDEQADDPF